MAPLFLIKNLAMINTKKIYFCLFVLIGCLRPLATLSAGESIGDLSSTFVETLKSRNYEASFKMAGLSPLSGGSGPKDYSSHLLSYESDGLKQYALMNLPKTKKPERGFPVLIFGHGFHPEPKKYGLNKVTNLTHRPGDYYRGIPAAFAEQGFVVLAPDYRGHANSEGYEYTRKSYLSSAYYAIDVLHLLDALPGLKDIDQNNIFYLGHSMGGEVGLRVFLSTGNKIKAASLWSPAVATTHEKALYYGRRRSKDESVTPQVMQSYLGEAVSLDDLGPGDESRGKTVGAGLAQQLELIDPVHYVEQLSVPVIVQHAEGDQSAPIQWSESLVAKLAAADIDFEFYAYPTSNHLFEDDNFALAIERDLAFFRKYMRP